MKRLRSELSPGTSTIAAPTTSTIAATAISDRRRREAENSSGSGSASSSTGSRYSTVKVGRVLIREGLPEIGGSVGRLRDREEQRVPGWVADRRARRALVDRVT